MERELQHERVRQALTMKIRGPQAESDIDSRLQSRMAAKNLDTEAYSNKGGHLMNDPEFPDYVNSVANDDSTYGDFE